MKKTITNTLAVLAATTALVSTSNAQAEGTTDLLKKALIDDATPYIDVRYRFENSDDDALAKEGHASTLRTKLGYKTGKLHDFSATVEVENVSYLGGDNFNNGINGKAGTHAAIIDPDSTEINHAFLTYTGLEDTILQVGRQPHNLDNQRFIGTVGWRQNDQTYDSAAIINSSIEDTTLIYSYVDNVNRIFSSDHPLGDLDTHTHVINASYDGFKYGKLTGYGYLIDLNDAPAFGLSSKTFGARFTGDTEVDEGVKVLYTAEYARQSDYADNPTNYSADYYAVEGGVSASGVTAKLGYEVLGSDNGGTVAFSTPLATGHKFNGWADKFLATPGAGLEDLYASAFYKVSGSGNEMLDGTTLGVVYHDFSAETGGADYGDEWDAVIKQSFAGHYNVMLKYANYDADSFAADTEKFWLQLGAKF